MNGQGPAHIGSAPLERAKGYIGYAAHGDYREADAHMILVAPDRDSLAAAWTRLMGVELDQSMVNRVTLVAHQPE